MGMTRARLLPLLLVVVTGSCVTAGCGDDQDGGDGGDQAYVEGTPRQVATTIADTLARAEKKADCAPLKPINERSAYDFACPADPALRESMGKFEVVAVDRHGSAAIVNYKSGGAPDGASMIVNVKYPERRWAVSQFGILNELDERRGDGRARAGYDRAIEAYIAAIRRRDCKTYTRFAASLDGSEQGECRSDFKSTQGFRSFLKDNPDLKPRYMGGSDLFGFYSLDIVKPLPNPVTITMINAGPQDGEPYRVLSAVPGALTEKDLPKQQ